MSILQEHCLATPEEAIESMQRALDVWEGVIKAIRGALVPGTPRMAMCQKETMAMGLQHDF